MSSSGVPAFQELAGSPKFRMSHAGQSATRRFVVSWENVANFCRELARGGFSGRPMNMPSMSCWVSDILVEPYSEEHYPDSQVITDPDTAVNTYTGPGSKDKALITVQYDIDYYGADWPTTIPKPSVLNHHSLRMTMRTSGQFLTYPGRSGDWDGTPYASGSSGLTSGQATAPTSGDQPGSDVTGGGDLSRIAPDVGNRILLCIQDLRIEWYHCRDVDTATLDSYVGWVNNLAFLGGAPGTVLFEGYDLEEDHLVDIDSPHCWKVVLNFRKRVKRLGSGKWVTWNHDYKDRVSPGGDPGGWTLIKMSDGRLRYELGNLQYIFTFGAT